MQFFIVITYVEMFKSYPMPLSYVEKLKSYPMPLSYVEKLKSYPAPLLVCGEAEILPGATARMWRS
ncbi:hypothetical protein DPMN_021389 [Dreissena polymorpha]|uniref:Uncharacterized protein n=1 Tax=Dreissena polymorpha TaxID=45954 RepID=A0A9D4NNP0_DREPO|nr:hypothetical protein DPMN_021389 [Dreissena polymorpha]